MHVTPKTQKFPAKTEHSDDRSRSVTAAGTEAVTHSKNKDERPCGPMPQGRGADAAPSNNQASASRFDPQTRSRAAAWSKPPRSFSRIVTEPAQLRSRHRQENAECFFEHNGPKVLLRKVPRTYYFYHHLYFVFFIN